MTKSQMTIRAYSTGNHSAHRVLSSSTSLEHRVRNWISFLTSTIRSLHLLSVYVVDAVIGLLKLFMYIGLSIVFMSIHHKLIIIIIMQTNNQNKYQFLFMSNNLKNYLFYFFLNKTLFSIISA